MQRLLVALVAPLAGLGVLWGGIALASKILTGHEHELVQKVTPAR